MLRNSLFFFVFLAAGAALGFWTCLPRGRHVHTHAKYV